MITHYTRHYERCSTKLDIGKEYYAHLRVYLVLLSFHCSRFNSKAKRLTSSMSANLVIPDCFIIWWHSCNKLPVLVLSLPNTYISDTHIRLGFCCDNHFKAGPSTRLPPPECLFKYSVVTRLPLSPIILKEPISP